MAVLKQKIGTSAVARTVTANYEDEQVVHRTGSESVAGVKTFTELPQVPNIVDTSDYSMNVANTKFVKDVVSAAISSALDAIYPVGSYAFGAKPTVGTWEEVEGDRALWLKNTVDDGTTIEQALPNITGSVAAYSFNTGSPTGAFTVQSSNPRQSPAGGDTDRNFIRWDFRASSSNGIYKNGANVQPNAYVMKVYKRTA